MLRKLPMLRSVSSVALRMRSREAFLEPWALEPRYGVPGKTNIAASAHGSEGALPAISRDPRTVHQCHGWCNDLAIQFTNSRLSHFAAIGSWQFHSFGQQYGRVYQATFGNPVSFVR